MDTTYKIKFREKRNSEFYETLKKRTKTYLEANGLTRFATVSVYFKILFFVGAYLLSYYLIVTNIFSYAQTLLLWMLMGISGLCVILNVVHDAAHNAISQNRTVNKYLCYLGDLLGINTYIWNIRHNVMHHGYTNVVGGDLIIEQVPVLRFSEQQPHKNFHKYQHLYAPFFYALYSLFWIFYIDFNLFFKKSLGNYRDLKHPFKEYMILFVSKGFYITYAIIIPLLVIDLPWYQVITGFLVMHLFVGISLSLIAVLSHFVEGPSFPHPDQEGLIDNNWADHELETTLDFAPASKIMNWISGGLNTHVAHHLFPSVCHIHYYEITKIIRDTALEFKASYHEAKFWEALKSHFKYIKRLGNQK